MTSRRPGLPPPSAELVRAVNSEMVLAYWHIGREIVEEGQRGAGRAEYGEGAIDTLSMQLIGRFGRGLSGRNLRYFREFYVAIADRTPEIWQSTISESPAAESSDTTAPRVGLSLTP